MGYIAAYHNTNKVQGQMLIDFESSNRADEDLVLQTFERVNRPMAWFELELEVPICMNECSLKRALSNLTKDRVQKKSKIVSREAKLKITEEMVMGPEGKRCHRYALLKQKS